MQRFVESTGRVELDGIVTAEAKKPNAGDTVVLVGLPPEFLDDLPEEDQAAIAALVGKLVLLVRYDEDGRAELELESNPHDGLFHTRNIWVHPRFIRPNS